MHNQKNKIDDIILLMYQEQQSSNQQASKNLSNYINNLDELEKYEIFQQLIDDKLTNWKIQKGAYGDVVIFSIKPNLTKKGIKIAKFLTKPSWLKFLISTKNKISASIMFHLNFGIISFNIKIH